MNVKKIRGMVLGNPVYNELKAKKGHNNITSRPPYLLRGHIEDGEILGREAGDGKDVRKSHRWHQRQHPKLKIILR